MNCVQRSRESCDLCGIVVGPHLGTSTWQCDRCERDACSDCLGDYDYATDTGSSAVCRDCLAMRED